MRGIQSATPELKKYCYEQRKLGKTLAEIRKDIKDKGADVKENTISNWILEVKPDEEHSKFYRAIAHSKKQNALFNNVKVGDTITAIISKTSEADFAHSSLNDVVGRVTVVEKYPYFIRCSYKGKIYCIDKMSIISKVSSI